MWDLRTFHLLRTVPALNQSQVLFNNLGDIIYGVALEQESDEETEYDTSFKTLDATDYTSIGKLLQNYYITPFKNKAGYRRFAVWRHSILTSIARLVEKRNARNLSRQPMKVNKPRQSTHVSRCPFSCYKTGFSITL